MSRVTVMRLDIVIDSENLELEAEMQCGNLFDEDKVRELSQKFLEDIHSCTKEIPVKERAVNE